MIKKESSNKSRQKRHLRIRQTIIGTSQRPRLNVYRSNKAIYCQIIDDNAGHTLVAANTIEAGVRSANINSAQIVGTLIAKKALEKGITTVVFDRSGYLYHGRIKAVAEAARTAGLQF